LYKITFVGSLVSAGIAILIGAWLERIQTSNAEKVFSRLVFMTIALMLPLIFVGGYFASLGL